MKCPLETRPVYPWTPAGYEVLFVGEAPGEEEDKQGIPFVGRAGKLLRSWLKEVGLEGRYGLANVELHRPYDVTASGERVNWNRVPKPEEVAACLWVLEATLKRQPPKLVVCVGATASRYCGGYGGLIRDIAGEWRYNPSGLLTMTIYHPSALLRPMERSRRQEMERCNLDALVAVKRFLDQGYSDLPA